MAVAALVLGLIGLLAGLIPLFFFIAFPCGILAVIFGFVGRRRAIQRPSSGKGLSTAGLVMGALAIILGIIGVVIVNRAVNDISETLETAFEETTLPAEAAADLAIESGFTPNPSQGVVSAGALVTNNGAKTACGVEVQFTLLNSAGTPVDTDTTTVALIPAGQTVSVTPLQIGFEVADPAKMEVSVVGIGDQIESNLLDDCDGLSFQDGAEVDVVNPVLVRESGSSIEGQLSNPSDTKIETTYIACVLKLGGKIVGGESSASLDPIAPGATIAFSLSYISYEGPADEILCTARA